VNDRKVEFVIPAQYVRKSSKSRRILPKAGKLAVLHVDMLYKYSAVKKFIQIFVMIWQD